MTSFISFHEYLRLPLCPWLFVGIIFVLLLSLFCWIYSCTLLSWCARTAENQHSYKCLFRMGSWFCDRPRFYVTRYLHDGRVSYKVTYLSFSACLAYEKSLLPSTFSHILDLIYWTVLIFILNGVTLKTSNIMSCDYLVLSQVHVHEICVPYTSGFQTLASGMR